jgi:NAD(P)-dependent dehydrogenase (short-subunit alcohol dehydrogenase family)
VLVNNAGIGAQGDVSVNDRDEWHRVLDVNVVGTARMTAAALSSARNPEAEAAALNARQPMGRLVTPEEVARAILYLASPLSSSSTGVVRRAGAVRGTRVNTRHRVTPSAAL